MSTPGDARVEGQHRSLWPISPQCRTDFLRVVADTPHGTLFTVNTIRDQLDAAQIPDKARGGLMAGAMKAGLCEQAIELIDGFGPVILHVPSTGPTANASGVKVYRRTPPRKE